MSVLWTLASEDCSASSRKQQEPRCQHSRTLRVQPAVRTLQKTGGILSSNRPTQSSLPLLQFSKGDMQISSSASARRIRGWAASQVHIMQQCTIIPQPRTPKFEPVMSRQLAPVTQLYVSVDAATRDELKAIDRPLFKDFWQRFLDCLTTLRDKRQRTVYRCVPPPESVHACLRLQMALARLPACRLARR